MGYDIARFIDEVDEEFHCTICTLVFENPVQTLCDHSFCDECIREWIRVHAICPVDRRPLKTTDLKPTSRPFRNLLAKMQIKCDFQLQGCTSVINLEHLNDHVTTCRFNPTADIICDKGCNLKMRRQEYQANDCLAHYAKRVANQEAEIKKVTQELIDFKAGFQRALNREREEFRRAFDQQQKNHDRTLEQVRNVNAGVRSTAFPGQFGRQHFTPLQMDTSKRPMWQQVVNMTISPDQSTLEPTGNWGAFSQLCYPLDQLNPSFKVQILKANCSGDNYGYIGIGFSDKEVGVAFSVGYYNDGTLRVSTAPYRNTTSSFEVGDIIECGINFAVPLHNDTTYNVQVYFSKNKELITTEVVKRPVGGFYPCVWMYNPEKQIKYLSK